MKFFKFLQKNLYKHPVKRTLRILFFSIFFVPVCLISVFFIHYFTESLSSWELEKVQKSIEYTKMSIESSLVQVTNLSDRIFINKQLQSVLTTEYNDVQEVYSAYTNLRFLEDYLRSYNEISSYRIYTENYSLLDNQFIIKTTSNIKNEIWYKRAIEDKGGQSWFYTKDVISKKMNLSLIRSLWNSSTNTSSGVLVINLNPDYFEKNVLTNENSTYVLYNNLKLFSKNLSLSEKDNNILNSYLLTHNEKEYELHKINLKDENIGLVISNFSSLSNPSLNFKIAYVIPYKNLTNATNVIVTYLIGLIIIIILLSTLLIIIFSKYISKRVQKVQKGISKVVTNNFEIPETIGGKDEFEFIYHDLYEMSCNIKELINKVYVQEIEKEHLSAKQNEISFKMLSSQINPHFLFNSLETIRMKSLSSGDKEVSTMLRILASLLRYNLSIKGTPVPLVQELEAIQNYLKIQHMRFGERISFDVIPTCNVSDYTMLPLLIQPVVENSFNHGLEEKVSGGFIYIMILTVEIDGETMLEINVKDNGIGISEKKLEELRIKLENSDNQIYTSSIGLVNVNTRIKLFYGPKYGIKIESVEGNGTTVKIHLPINYIKKEEETNGLL